MSEAGSITVKDQYLSRIKEAKSARAVVKIDFAAFASAVAKSSKIFAFEGPADKLAFYYWIKASKPTLNYEPYVCKNKFSVLQLFDALQSDLTGLLDRAYFFVDRDFDDLQGRVEHDRIFVTEKYSIENYIVCGELLDVLLKIDFHCEGHPKVREDVKAIFEETYNQFLQATADLNFRIFASRQLGIKQREDLPSRLNNIAKVSLKEVLALDTSVVDMVKLEREPLQEEVIKLKETFAGFVPKDRFRGKFALLFFVRWLALLRDDRLSYSPVCLKIPTTEFVVNGGFSLDNLAPKAPAPEKLGIFLSKIE